MSCDSLTRFDHPLHLELGRSARLRVAAACVHALAAAGCLLSAVHPALSVLLVVLTGLHLVRFLRCHVDGTDRDAVTGIAWDRERGWRVRGGRVHWRDARLSLPVFVTAHVVVVRFRGPGLKRYSAVIVGERLEPDDFRRLRVRLLQSARDYRE